jgi:uncharacterized protein involved in exopolysaccharide biosynthesis
VSAVLTPPTTVSDPDEITLHEAWLRLLVGWKIVVTTTIFFSGVAIAVAFIMTPTYDATSLLAISTQDEQGMKSLSLSGIASQFGMASSLFDLGNESSNQKAEAVATLQSRILTQTYIREQNLLPILFASKWDAKKGQWKDSDPEKQPTLWDGNKLFNRKIRTVSEDKKTGLVLLTISWKDKQLAAKWASDLVARANAYLRDKALDTSARHIAYLNEELGRTNVLELQEAIYRLLEIEIKKTMLARGNDQYAFKTLDPPVVPQDRARPKRLLISAFGLCAGIFLGVVIAVLRARQHPETSTPA